jgi:hypothetical protein
MSRMRKTQCVHFYSIKSSRKYLLNGVGKHWEQNVLFADSSDVRKHFRMFTVRPAPMPFSHSVALPLWRSRAVLPWHNGCISTIFWYIIYFFWCLFKYTRSILFYFYSIFFSSRLFIFFRKQWIFKFVIRLSSNCIMLKTR